MSRFWFFPNHTRNLLMPGIKTPSDQECLQQSISVPSQNLTYLPFRYNLLQHVPIQLKFPSHLQKKISVPSYLLQMVNMLSLRMLKPEYKIILTLKSFQGWE